MRTAAAAALTVLAVLAGAGAARGQSTDLPTLRIEITGHQFQWHVRYPGPDDELGTPDDLLDKRHVRVPLGRDVELVLHSQDYLYTLALPHASLKEIAVPDLTFSMRLTPDRVGTFELRGDQFCGYSHPDLMGDFVVMTQSDFERWTLHGGSPSLAVKAPE